MLSLSPLIVTTVPLGFKLVSARFCCIASLTWQVITSLGFYPPPPPAQLSFPIMKLLHINTHTHIRVLPHFFFFYCKFNFSFFTINLTIIFRYISTNLNCNLRKTLDPGHIIFQNLPNQFRFICVCVSGLRSSEHIFPLK